MTRKRGGTTAADVMAMLEADPEFVARRAARDVEQAAREEALRCAEVDLVDDLRRAGTEVDSVWDLVNTAAPYPSAVPVLFAHLARAHPPAIREGIARALAVPEARSRRAELVRAYRDETEPRAKDGLAVAVAATCGGDGIDEVIALVGDAGQGASRVLLIRALARSKEPRARRALESLHEDPVLGEEARAASRRRVRGR